MAVSKNREERPAEDPKEPGQIFTFYSYKGGTGRSLALANVACLLAQREEGAGGILMVDWDLEAPGLHRYFADRFQRTFENSNERLERQPGVIDLFLNLRSEVLKLPESKEEPTLEVQDKLKADSRFESFFVATDVPNLSILKAGCFDDDYAKKVNTFDWEELYERAPWLITVLADWFTSHFRYTLIDSRTGITDTSGICTMLLPEKLVAVFTPNQQSLDGVLQMCERATNYRSRSTDLRRLSVFPLPSRIEMSEPKELEHWRKDQNQGYQPRFEALFNKVCGQKNCNLEPYFNEVQIQHASTYAYGEKVAVLIEQGDNRISLKRAFATFAERLVVLADPWEVPKTFETMSMPDGGVARQAESRYGQLKPDQHETARRLFLQLVRLAADSRQAVGRELKTSLLPDREIVMTFVDAKVIELRETETGQTAAIADEPLITGWRRLSDWIEADREFLIWRDSLDAALANWQKLNRHKSALLRGVPLEEAQKNLESRNADLNTSELEFINASTAAENRSENIVALVGLGASMAIAVAVSYWMDLNWVYSIGLTVAISGIFIYMLKSPEV